MSIDNFDFPANWKTRVTEEIAFKTEIIKSRDGTEQRIAQRINPRYSWTWSILATGNELYDLERRLARNQGRVITFAHPRAAALTERGQPGAAGIPGRFTGGTRVEAFTDGVAQVRVSILATPGGFLAEGAEVPDYGAAATLYNALELFELSPNWVSPTSVLFEQNVENFDFQRGVIDFYMPELFTNRIMTLDFLLHTLAREQALLGLFFRCKGKQKDFYMADPLTTLDIVRPVADGATTVTVLGTEAFDAFSDQPMYRHISISTETSGTIRRRVTSVTSLVGETVLTLDAPLPAIPVGDISSIRWLLRCRFETDAIVLDWTTATVARTTLTVRAVEELP